MREYVIICAWHERYFDQPKVLSRKYVVGIGAPIVSHGICPECAKIAKAEIKEGDDHGKHETV